MKVFPGDVVYNAKGRPGIVVDRDAFSGQVTADMHGEKLEKARKYGFINGLTPEDREQFYAIIDNINKHTNVQDKVNAYTKQIEELKAHPKNRHLVHYLSSEQAHLMFSEGVYPKTFTMDETKT